MPTIRPRDLLCWINRTRAKGIWQPSVGNSIWRPVVRYYPDTRNLLPGDILLFQALNPTITEKAIEWFQRSPFTHAAVYIGLDHEVCEATPGGGVAFNHLEDLLPGNCLLVRRVPGISFQDRNRIAIAAGAFRKESYGWKDVFALVLQRYLRIRPKANAKSRKGVICSVLCEHAILEGTLGKLVLREDMNSVVTPAELAATKKLEDVAIEWVRVVR